VGGGWRRSVGGDAKKNHPQRERTSTRAKLSHEESGRTQRSPRCSKRNQRVQTAQRVDPSLFSLCPLDFGIFDDLQLGLRAPAFVSGMVVLFIEMASSSFSAQTTTTSPSPPYPISGEPTISSSCCFSASMRRLSASYRSRWLFMMTEHVACCRWNSAFCAQKQEWARDREVGKREESNQSDNKTNLFVVELLALFEQVHLLGKAFLTVRKRR